MENKNVDVKIALDVLAVIAGLAATGRTEIEDILYIDRGYENIVEKFGNLGADIRRVYRVDPFSSDTAG